MSVDPDIFAQASPAGVDRFVAEIWSPTAEDKVLEFRIRQIVRDELRALLRQAAMRGGFPEPTTPQPAPADPSPAPPSEPQPGQ